MMIVMVSVLIVIGLLFVGCGDFGNCVLVLMFFELCGI